MLGTISVALALIAAASTPPPGMALIPAGTFLMGSRDKAPDEAPVHEVAVGAFWIDRHEVTVAEFGAFIAGTRYRSEAERFGSYVQRGSTNNDRKKALADVFWALLNSSEFVLNH